MSISTSDKPQIGPSRRDDLGGRATMSDIRQDINSVRHDLGKLKDDAVDAAGGVAAGAADTVRHGADYAIDVARKGVDQARHGYDQVCDFVRERPTTSLLIAVGVGAVIARLLIPRK